MAVHDHSLVVGFQRVRSLLGKEVIHTAMVIHALHEIAHQFCVEECDGLNITQKCDHAALQSSPYLEKKLLISLLLEHMEQSPMLGS
jgi:hypothetical protein